MPQRYRTMISVLHELAHEWMWCPLLQGHGPEFAGAFVALVREFMGEDEAECLVGSFLVNRVRVAASG
jgi:hypothetical protein